MFVFLNVIIFNIRRKLIFYPYQIQICDSSGNCPKSMDRDLYQIARNSKLFGYRFLQKLGR